MFDQRIVAIVEDIMESGDYSRFTKELSFSERIEFFLQIMKFESIEEENNFQKKIELLDETAIDSLLKNSFTREEFFKIIDDGSYDKDFRKLVLYDIGRSILNDEEKIDILTQNEISDLSIYEIVNFISSISDLPKKLELLEKYESKLSLYNIIGIIKSTSDLFQKLELLEKYESKLTLYDIAGIINSTSDFSQKLELLEKYESKLGSYDIAGIINSTSDFSQKLELLEKYASSLDSFNIAGIINSTSDLPKKLELLEKYESKFNSYNFASIINSISDLPKKLELLEKYASSLDSFNIASIINSISDLPKKLELLKKYKSKFNSHDINNVINYLDIDTKGKVLDLFIDDHDLLARVILSISELEEKKKLLVKYRNKLELVDINNIINVEVELNKKLFLLNSIEASTEIDVNKLFDYGIINLEIGPGAKEDLIERLGQIIRKYNSVKPSISVLKALIAIEAKNSFIRKRFEDLNNGTNLYLPSGLPEILNNIVSENQTDTIFRDNEFNRYYNVMISLVDESYDVKRIADVLKMLSKRDDERLFDNNDNKYYNNKMRTNKVECEIELNSKKEESFLKMQEIATELGVTNISVDECKLISFVLNKLNIKNTIIKKAYYQAIMQVLNEEGKELSQFFSNIDTDEERINKSREFQKIFSKATNKVIKMAILDENRSVEGGLLTQISSYVLNIEQEKEVKNEKYKLIENIVSELVLTQKGINKINIERVKSIINNDEVMSKVFNDNSKKFSERIEFVFEKLFPQYSGKKSLETLYGLMKSDSRFSEEMSKDITFIEKMKIPIDKDFFEIDKKLQQQKNVMAILGVINNDRLSFDETELNPVLVDRLDILGQGIELILKNESDEAKELGLLIFDDIDIIKSQNIGQLLLYFKHIKTSSRDKDKKISSRLLNSDNLGEYINRVNQVTMVGSKYNVVLGDEVVYTIEPKYLKANYQHYIDKTSKRFYRTIPDIKGNFESKGNNLTFRTYDVDDPEQLIAGARMTKDVKASCFRIGNAQSQTFEYITSSPNGVIVAIENEKGEFLGRVYGFRVGNSVHFTRMYYNIVFDFEEAMKRISRAIIDSSKEIEYVTCIPDTSVNERYIKDGILISSEGVNISQEGVSLYTDHTGRDLMIVASRKNLLDSSQVELKREGNTEKFYKQRRKPQFVDLSEIENEKEVLNIIHKNEKSAFIVGQIDSAEQIILGEDWIIIDDGEKLVSISMDFGDSEESIKYKEIVDSEIEEVMKKLEIGKLDSTKENILAGFTKEELENLKNSLQQQGRSL